MIPTIGRIVLYTLSVQDADAINKRRQDFSDHRRKDGYGDTGFVAHTGNSVREGDVFPAVIVRTWGATEASSVNVQVLLDGSDTYWATSVSAGDGPRHFQWPTITKKEPS